MEFLIATSVVEKWNNAYVYTYTNRNKVLAILLMSITNIGDTFDYRNYVG